MALRLPLRSALIVALLTALGTGCGDEPATPATAVGPISVDRAEAIAAAAAIDPTTLGPAWVDVSSSVEETDDEACRPDDAAALAITPFLSGSNHGGGAADELARDPSRVDELLAQAEIVTFRTWVFADEETAGEFTDQLRGLGSSACVGAGVDDAAQLTDPEDLDVPADEASWLVAEMPPDDGSGEGLRFALAVVRNGVAVSFVASLSFDGTVDDQRLVEVSTLLHDRITRA